MALLTPAAVVVGALVVAAAAAAALPPLGGHALGPAQRSTPAGVPVPRAAVRCPDQAQAQPGAVLWCLPAGTSPQALWDWYAEALPPGASSAGLRWCRQQVRANGSTVAVWTAGRAQVGYQLPPAGRRPPDRRPEADHGLLVMAVLKLPGRSCPRLAG